MRPYLSLRYGKITTESFEWVGFARESFAVEELPGPGERRNGGNTDLALRATTWLLHTAVGRKLCGLAWGRYVSVETVGSELRWIHYLGMDKSPAVQWRRKMCPTSKPMMLAQGVMGMHSVLAVSGAQGVLPCFVGDRDASLPRIGEPIAMNQLWLLVHADLRRSARVRALIDFLVPRLLADRAHFEASV